MARSVDPSFGIGLDVVWGPGGFVPPGRPDDGLLALLERLGPSLGHVFFSLQSPTRGVPDLQEVLGPLRALVQAARAAGIETVALHHTLLNLASPPHAYPRGPILELTNTLCEALGFAWINEDLGYWSVGGQPLAYPLPPLLTEAGIEACVASITRAQEVLTRPLHVEFPGFAAGLSEPCLGDIDAFNFFREVVHRSGAVCTLDVGHLLSWRWLLGHRGEDLFEDWEALPLDACREIHVAGARIVQGAMIDAHDGHILDDQLRGLRWLLVRTPNLTALTFEDPRFDRHGVLEPDSEQGFNALLEAMCP